MVYQRSSSTIKNHGHPRSMPGTGSEPPSAQSPFARLGRYLQRGDVKRLLGRYYPAVVATTNSCASPHPSRPPRFVSLVPPVLAGCGQPLLGGGLSRRYLCHPWGGAWTLTPPRSSGASTRYFPEDIGLTLESRGSARRKIPAKQLEQGGYFGAAVINSCSGSPTCLAPRLRPPQDL